MPPRKDLTLSEKVEILRKFDALPKCSQRVASKLLEIPQSSLSRILQKRDAITAEVSVNLNVDRKRKRSGKGSIIEHVLLDWYFKTKENGEPVNRSVLAKKAEELAKEYGLDNFVATDGWLTRWIARNNVSWKKRDSEIISAGKRNLLIEGAKNWISENVPLILASYAPNQVYNTDETVIHFCDISEHPTKLSEKDLEPLTVVLTCNMIGEKEYPLIVGKNTYSELTEVKELPLHYEISEDGLMTRDIFASFLLRWDVTLSNKNIVLLLDSSYVHFENLGLKNMKLVFIPSDLIPIVQPLSQGIIHMFKSLYKKNIKMKVDDIVKDEKRSADRIISNATFLSLLEAWMNVQSKYICDCFRKAGFLYKRDFRSSIIEEISKINMKPHDNVPLSCVEVVSEKTDENTAFKWASNSASHSDQNVMSDKTEKNVDNIFVKKELENEQSTPVEIKDTYNAFSVIRKTLDQNSASPVCYELLQKLEKEVNGLLQKSS